MIIWGRIIGALLGYRMLGLFGAMFGYWVGEWFDKGLKTHLHGTPRKRPLEAQEAFFTATFLVMGHIAKADGRVSENEIRVAQNIMDRLELNDKLKKEAARLFSEGKEPNFNLTATLSKLYRECHRHPDLLRFFIEIQLEAGLADGQLHPEERRILLLICEQLHFSPQDFEQLWARQWAGQAFHEWFSSQFDPNARSRKQQYSYQQNTGGQRQSYSGARTSSSSLQDAYGVLGIVPSATQAEIKKAYRRLMNQHHPDKLAARGLPENMMKLAKEKTQQIRAAYDLVREARGFR